ncbi:MAG TPA: hypothetical protein VK906_02770 [Egicoccus sp.]|nr:hypothetical protein [Egicoccus sp.]HSK22067.1 hypothetical protein [Egicoccus sp.]
MSAVTDEARGWGRLAGHVADGVVARTVHHVHRAVADRVFTTIGPIAAPVRLGHDVVSEGVYALVRGSVRGAGLLGGLVAGFRSRHHDLPWHERSPAGSRLAAVAHGLLGDLAQVAPPLDLPLVIREAGTTVPPDRDALAAAFPDATGRVAVFLHGLVEDETIWGPSETRTERLCLPAAVAEQGLTPVRLRYGTGTPIGRNGAALADLLEALVAGWPVPVSQLVLVGHSMGGLVARSACLQAGERGHTWTRPLDHVVYLGTPHLGAPLEQVVHRWTRTLGRVPEVAPFIDILERRSAGIRDLRHGSLTEQAADLAEAVEPPPDEPWLADVDHHLVVGRLARGERHPVNRVFGDLLVTAPSATGRDGSRHIEGERVHVLAVPANHFGLCWHPSVAEHLQAHLAGQTA